MVMWPKTILPSVVAGPVAAKALQCIGLGAGFGVRPAQRKAYAFQPGRRGLQGRVERLDLGPGVEGDDVEQVDGPAVEAAPRPRWRRRRCPSFLRDTRRRSGAGTGR